MARNFLSIDDLQPDELQAILDLSESVKADPARHAKGLQGKAVSLIFEKPSTRTRVSFEVAVAGLGGHPLVLSSTEMQLGRERPSRTRGGCSRGTRTAWSCARSGRNGS